jgi:hypothetical protein
VYWDARFLMSQMPSNGRPLEEVEEDAEEEEGEEEEKKTTTSTCSVSYLVRLVMVRDCKCTILVK